MAEHGRLAAAIRREWLELTTVNPSDRPWEMPFAAALALGLPMFAGAAAGRMQDGVIASLAGLVFLYLPATAMHHRMVVLMTCSFGMICSYAIGAVGHLVPVLMVPLITICTILVTMLCNFYRIGPPGSLFFIMAAAVGVYTPGTAELIPHRVGLIALGCMNAAAIAFLYSIRILRRRPAEPKPESPAASFGPVWLDPIVIGLLVGLSLVLAELLHLEKPYWVPLSCLAIIQGMSLRHAWNRQVHRLLGTAIGLALTWPLLFVVRDGWTAAVALTTLSFIVNTAIVRHYGFAVIFITPLTILLAEAAILAHPGNVGALMQARLLDTLLGSAIGFVGAALLHNAAFRRTAGGWLRRIVPARLVTED